MANINLIKIILCIFILVVTTNCIAGNSLEVEKGNSAYKQKDYKTAYKIFFELSNKGDAYSQYKIGSMYDWGDGVKKDSTEAVKWYRKSAEQGFEEAQYCLGVMYNLGDGVKQNYSIASKWYRNEVVKKKRHPVKPQPIPSSLSRSVVALPSPSLPPA